MEWREIIVKWSSIFSEEFVPSVGRMIFRPGWKVADGTLILPKPVEIIVKGSETVSLPVTGNGWYWSVEFVPYGVTGFTKHFQLLPGDPINIMDIPSVDPDTITSEIPDHEYPSWWAALQQIELSKTGPQGEQGERGPQGRPGRDGVDGKDGADGVDGRNGTASPEDVAAALQEPGPARNVLNAAVNAEMTARAKPVVADIISNDPTVAQAAANLAQSDAGLIRISRLVNSAGSPLVFSALNSGRYQITRTADGAVLGLPTGDHGILEVDRWQTSTGRPGMATWTTKPTVLGDTEVWTTDIDGTGNAVGWTLATGSGRDQYSEADMGLRHHYISSRHAATIGGPIDVGTATPVCMTWDDYPGSFKAHGIAELAAQYEIPMTIAVSSRTLDPGNEHLIGNGSVTWAEIDGWVQGGWVELANHSATHAKNRTEADMHDEIVTALAELQAHSPTKPIRTWIMPDNSWPDLDEGRTADGWASHAGQLILGHHAFASGKDSIRSDHTVPMTGIPFQGANRRWIEAEGLTDAVRQNLVASSYGTNRGVILAAHPLWIGQGSRWTLAQVETFLAWLAAERDAGRALPMFLSQWPWAKSSNPA